MDIEEQQFVKSKSRLELTNDYVFKRIFAKPENNKELKEFIEAILGIKINKVEVKNPEISKNYSDERLGVLDIRAHIDEKILLDVEMQVANVKTLVDRNIGYGSRLIAEDTRVRENYVSLKKFISINILGENLLKRNAYHSVAHLKFEETEKSKYVDMGYKEEQETLTDKIEAHYIELNKFIKSKPGLKSKLEQWLWLLTGEDEKIKMASEENKTIEKVVEELDEMSADENERLEAYKRKLAIIDYNTSIDMAHKEGRKEGRKEGEKIGREAGEKAGRKAEQLKIAKRLKEKGIELAEIMDITELTKEEIEKI